MGTISNAPAQASGKGGNAPVYGQTSVPSGPPQSNQQPQFGMPNRYANSVGSTSWDNASLYPRGPVGGGKGGKVQPSGVGYPSQSAGKGGAPIAQVAQRAQQQQPVIESPIRNVQANSANALYASRGATGDPEGMKYWQGRYAAGEDPAQIQRDFNASFDYVKGQQKAG
jgi:hypothetical protein